MTTRVALDQIQGVKILAPKNAVDDRGSFTKYFDRVFYASLGLNPNFDSLSIATNIETGTIRGLHFQSPPFDEEKMIVCLQGLIYDVVVDLRSDSSTLGKWATIELSDNTPQSLYLPKGIAHGYQTLSPDAKVFYGLTSPFNPQNAHSLNYAEKNLNIEWPLRITKISPKDSAGISLKMAIALAAGLSL